MTIATLEPVARENLIRLAKWYCDLTGHTIGTVGRYAHSDPGFFKDLVDRHKKWERAGRPGRVDDDRKGSFTFRVYDKVVAWFIANTPEGAEFPVLNDLFHQPQEVTDGPKGERQAEKAPQEREETRDGTADQAGSASATLGRLRNRRQVQKTDG